jgi:hypothetical protein
MQSLGLILGSSASCHQNMCLPPATNGEEYDWAINAYVLTSGSKSTQASLSREDSKFVGKQAQTTVPGGALQVNPAPGTAQAANSSTDF